jgi:hypothetical protein
MDVIKMLEYYGPRDYILQTMKVGQLGERYMVLLEHGVYEERLNTSEGEVIVLLKDSNALFEELIREGVHYEAASVAVKTLGNYEVHRSFPGETFKDFMIRLGWISKFSSYNFDIA